MLNYNHTGFLQLFNIKTGYLLVCLSLLSSVSILWSKFTFPQFVHLYPFAKRCCLEGSCQLVHLYLFLDKVRPVIQEGTEKGWLWRSSETDARGWRWEPQKPDLRRKRSKTRSWSHRYDELYETTTVRYPLTITVWTLSC